ncbi:MAG: hypothetical protein RL689_215, partial [Planctomycetota bacterium]
MSATAGDDTLTGTAGNDAIDGLGGDDVIDGMAGNDTLTGGSGNDTLVGGTGIDAASYAGAASGVNVDLGAGTATGGDGNDTLSQIENVTGSAFNDTLTGDAGDNALDGGGGDDLVDGGAGNDTLTGGTGNDTLIGGTGTDTATYAGTGSGVMVHLGMGIATGGDGSDTLSGIENVTGSGSADTLTGDAGNNVLDGGGGNDTITGGEGNDTLTGGAGTDTASYANATSAVTVSLVTNTATGGDGSDTLSGIENVTGSGFNDTLTGDVNANVLDGGAGNDTLNGGAGNDTLIGGAGTDTATYASAAGAITVNLTTGTATGEGTDTLSGIENVTGSNQADVITGDAGNNVLDGGGGNDTLNGGAGNDPLIGGAGTDTASYATASGSVNVDLTVAAAQDTGGAGVDTLSSIERVIGSSVGDVFAFTQASAGATYTIDGGGGNDVIDLLGFSSGQVDFSGGSGVLTVSLGGGASFTILYSNVSQLLLADGLTSASNFAPEASAGTDFAIAEGGLATLDGTASSDPEGVALTYSWTQLSGPTVTLSDPAAASPTFVAPNLLANANLVFEVTVSDGQYLRSDTVTVTVNADNDAAAADAGVDQTVDEGDVVSLAATATDPEGQGLTYAWTQVSGPAVTLSGASTATPSFTAPEGLTNSSVVLQCSVSDGTNTTVDTVTVTVNADNDAPAVDAGSNQTVNEGDVVTLAATASDPEGQGLTYTWTQVSGPAVTLSAASTAAPSFTAPEGLTNSSIVLQCSVSDGTNTTVDTVTVTVNADNDAPAVDAGVNQTVNEGDVVTLAAMASDPEGQGLTYTWTQVSGPAVTLSGASTATPSFTAPEGLTNSSVVLQCSVSDGTNTTVDTVTVTVNADNDAPAVEAGANQTVSEGDVVTLAATATDPE